MRRRRLALRSLALVKALLEAEDKLKIELEGMEQKLLEELAGGRRVALVGVARIGGQNAHGVGETQAEAEVSEHTPGHRAGKTQPVYYIMIPRRQQHRHRAADPGTTAPRRRGRRSQSRKK